MMFVMEDVNSELCAAGLRWRAG